MLLRYKKLINFALKLPNIAFGMQNYKTIPT